MDFRVVTLLLIISTVFLRTDGHPPKCCVAVSKRIPLPVLKDMYRYEEQHSSGLCDIDAVIIYTQKIKRICAHPRIKKRLEWLMNKNMLPSVKIAAP